MATGQRLVELESLVSQQQSQINELSYAVTHRLEALRGNLKDVCSLVSALRVEGALDASRTEHAMEAAASKGSSTLTKAPVKEERSSSKGSTAKVPPIPRHEEPSDADLEKWARSVAVREIFSSYVVEDIVGSVDSMKFTDVYHLFLDMGLSVPQFVRHFTAEGSPHHGAESSDVADMASSVLRKYASNSAEREADVIKHRDLYRVLEKLGYSLGRFCAKFTNRDPEVGGGLVGDRRPKIGSYWITDELGAGSNGVSCYRGQHVQSAAQVAIKWPVDRQELNTLEAIQRHWGGECLGVAPLLDSGTFDGTCTVSSGGQLYMVTELLGSPFTKVFSRLQQALSLDQRWDALSIVGRMLVRRLKALHDAGYVHCDISPENILLGHIHRGGKGPLSAPFLIDFGLAQRYPGGQVLGGEFGSAEWHSIRSAEDVERRPEDDLEALGWVLLTGLFGTLPWVEWLAQAYADWGSPATRNSVLRRVQRAKIQVLEEGWTSLGWAPFAQVPEQLDSFLHECRSAEAEPGQPDYFYLLALLGCNPDLQTQEAEDEDLRQFRESITPLL